MNRLTIIGNLTRDPETGTTEGGVNWCRFTVAVNRKYKKEGQPEADYMQITAWRGLGDNCAKFLRKGKKVAVVGAAKVHAWITKDGEAAGQIEMDADEVEFLSSGGGRANPTDADAPPAPVQRDPQTGMEVVNPEDIPY